MKPPADGWDRDERDALAPIEDELASLRARHRDDPPLELLRAAAADALPRDLQARVSEHLSESAWSRTLAAGANDVEHSLDDAAADRLLARIVQTADARRPWFAKITFWAPILATAAAVAIVAVVWPVRRTPASAPPVAATPAATVARNEPPPFELPLRPPDVRLSVAALTWRGPSGAPSFVDDLAPALDAFRQSDYDHASQLLERLEPRYPKAIEPPFYRGISLLFLNDAAGALAELQRAEHVADGTFAPDVAWYLAVAEQRAGRTADARARLQSLCGSPNTRAADACDAAKKLDGAR